MIEDTILNSLITGNWEQIVTQGGQLESSPEKTSYWLRALWVQSSERWIELSAVELENDIFKLTLYEEQDSPIPEKSKINNPPRELLIDCPKDCPLTDLVSFGVKSVEVLHVEKKKECFEIESPLIIEANNGKKFVFTASEGYPEMIELVCIA